MLAVKSIFQWSWVERDSERSVTFDDSLQTADLAHAALVLEREVPATVDKVFEAFANA
jgi:hypothetical protein